MPQTVPFYYFNQLFFGFFVLLALIYIFSVYLLPKQLQLYLTRLFISKL